ncbi:MAG: ATP-binding protein [Jatrophihabitantaceae bacterium]
MADRWPFVGRAGELARIDSLITSGVGALVVGEPGIGKTALARSAEERLGSAMPVGHVLGHAVGHAVSTGAPFEAFAGVLTAADTPVLSPVEVARRVADAFARRPGSRVLFVVDDAQLLDELSAQVLLQLAAESTAIVLATAPDRELPAAVDRLWRDGWCERIELAGLADDEVLELIETALGARSDAAPGLAHRGRPGSPGVLRRSRTGADERRRRRRRRSARPASS